MPAATRDMLWNVAGFRLCGFQDQAKEREHVWKHLFSPRERWQDLGVQWNEQFQVVNNPAATPAAKDAAWSHASLGYVGTVKRDTSQLLGGARNGLHIPPGGRGFPVVVAWTHSGIYASFAQRYNLPSQLATAMRPLLSGTNPPFMLRHFVDGVRWKYFNRRED